MRALARMACLGSLLLVGLAVAPWPARADLGGVSLSAVAFGVRATYNEPQAPIPQPTFEFDVAYAEAQYHSGPNSHALSSVFWPGVTFADGGPAFCGQMGVPFDCPASPVRAEAFSPSKPHSDTNPYGPNTTMEAKAGVTSAESFTTMQSSDQAAPAIVTGNYTSSTSSAVVGDDAVSQGSALVSDLTIAGVVEIGTVHTEAKAVTNGKNGVVSGETVISGASVNGQAVTIDEKGVHVGDQTAPVFDPINQGQVQQALNQAGLTLKVAAPVDSLKGAEAGRSLGGLVVTYQPPGAAEEATYSIGGVTVDSNTLAGYGGYTPPTSPPPTSGGGFGSTGGSGGSGGSFGGSTGGGFGSGGVTVGGSSSTGSSGTVATSPVAAPLSLPPVKGVPAGLAVFSILAAAALAAGLRKLAEGAIAAGAGERCPLEEER